MQNNLFLTIYYVIYDMSLIADKSLAAGDYYFHWFVHFNKNE